MRLSRLPLLYLFRTLVLGLLMLGVAIKPVLAELCDAHEISHAVAGVEGAAAASHVDTAAEARSDRDHASGAHQSLHASDASAAFVELFPALTVPPVHFAALTLPSHEASAPPAHRFDSPFRPPIA